MPELPDVELYLHALRVHFQGASLEKIIVRSPFVVRTFEIDLSQLEGRAVNQFSRIGKRIVWHFDDELFLVLHLMITGRFHKRAASKLPKGKNELVAFAFPDSTLMLTEAGTKKRASMHLVKGDAALAEFDRGGLDVLHCSRSEFASQLQSQNRTIKRLLTMPDLFDGIGNAYSDEILLEAGLSPFKRSRDLSDSEISRLFDATQSILTSWRDRLIDQTGDAFPEKVTAFRPEMLAHGKFGEPCAKCSTTIQRVRYADNEMNYCPKCQTGGKVLADRSLSRLLKDDWPKTIEELE